MQICSLVACLFLDVCIGLSDSTANAHVSLSGLKLSMRKVMLQEDV